MLACANTEARERLAQAELVWLFLDYDGTLAEFAETPDEIHIDLDLILLLTRLVDHPRIKTAVVSGRRLAHVQELLPVPGLWLAGSYGLELLAPDGERIDRLDLDRLRPQLDEIKPLWESLLEGRSGFFLEDKSWTLAIHARFAQEEEAAELLETARTRTEPLIAETDFHLLGGDRFLEVCPIAADKGRAIEYLLEADPFPGAMPLYIGDDDKDEHAFEAVQRNQGVAIVVSETPRPDSLADCQLLHPSEVRRWLNAVIGEGRT